MAVFVAVVLAVSVLALVWASGRAREICVLSVRGGRVLVMRGALPPSLYEGLADVVERQRTVRGTIRVLRDGERARLEVSGLDEYAAQRARNVLGTYPLPRLLAAGHRWRARGPASTPAQPRNLGQRLGLSRLAWRLYDAAEHAAKQRTGH